MPRPGTGRSGAQSARRGAGEAIPEYGASASALASFADKQLVPLLTKALASLLKHRPKSASAFLSRWLALALEPDGESRPKSAAVLASLAHELRPPSATSGRAMVTPEASASNDVGDTSPTRSPTKVITEETAVHRATLVELDSYDEEVVDPVARREALIEPEAAETDLVVDAAHITEYVRFLDTHIKPLLSQAVAAAMRARSESMLQFVIKFLEDANVQMRELRVSDSMLRSCKLLSDERSAVVAEVAGTPLSTPRGSLLTPRARASRHAAAVEREKQSTRLVPTMTADMKLKLVKDQSRVTMSAVVAAARDTFDSLEMTLKTLPKAANMERSAVRDKEALCECLLLTATTMVHGLKGLSAAFVAAVAAMRSDLGFVPPCEQRIILEYLLETRSDITKLLEELHNTVLFYSERNLNMQGGHFIVENYFTRLREGILVKVEELATDVDTELDNIAVDICSLFDKRKPALLTCIHSCKVHSGDLLAYRKEAFRLRDACRAIYESAEEHIRRKLKSNQRVRRPPTFCCMARTQILMGSVVMAHMTLLRVQDYDRHELQLFVTTTLRETRASLDALTKLVDRRSAEMDVAKGVMLEDSLLVSFGNVQSAFDDWTRALGGALLTAMQTGRASLSIDRLVGRMGRAVPEVDLQPLVDTHIKAIDQSLSALAEWLSTAVRGDMAARDAMRACAPTLLGCLDSLQRLPGEAVEAFVRRLAADVVVTPAMRDVSLAASLMQPIVRYHMVQLGRYLPFAHPSFMSERMAAAHAAETYYMPRQLAEIKAELEAQRKEEALAAAKAAKQERLAARAGKEAGGGMRLPPRPPASPRTTRVPTTT